MSGKPVYAMLLKKYDNLGECRRSPWYFGECRTCLGSGPAPEPTLRTCAKLVQLVGRRTNTEREREREREREC